MDKYKRYYGLALFAAVVLLSLFLAYSQIMPKIQEDKNKDNTISQKTEIRDKKKKDLDIVIGKIKRLKESIAGSTKKIYSPVESDLGNDTLFFTLYNDVIEMVHANSIKIKSIQYTYNPAADEFVKFGKDVYFVCDIDMELISNYNNLAKLIQDVYQYPYYIKINDVSVRPYERDKRILISKVNLRLYAHTMPDEETPAESVDVEDAPMPKLGEAQ